MRWMCMALIAMVGANAQTPTFSADVKVVNLLATARNRDGSIVTDLTKDDFEVEEDGKKQQIKYFSQQSNLPLVIGLLIDTSWSQRHIMEQERSASLEFLKRVLRQGKDQAWVVSFDIGVHMYQRTTPSLDLVRDALKELEVPVESPTHLYEGIAASAEDLMRKQQGRKAVILISDGIAIKDRVSLSNAIEYAQRADELVYAIVFSDYQAGYGDKVSAQQGAENRALGTSVMKRIGIETGGGYYEASKSMPLEKIYDQIEQELRNQYSIGYEPPESADKKYRKIKLTVKRKRVTVKTRDGYYPQ
jgi:VWFA-related protein